ncbi:MAG: YgjP-like metallopeptidase domain-containing protein, partial [Bacillota bacterium]|nr:YgjP-like metallopeptidase domain-containing protein [Bacillota bacterium]
YNLVRSRRKSLALIVKADNTLEVRSPLGMPKWRIDRFVQEKAVWINRKRQENQTQVPIRQETAETAVQADRFIHERIVHLMHLHQLPAPGKIMIKDLISRWGSCSKTGTISINRRCASLPVALLDYVILHEFCHISQLNHGPAFWQLLSHHIPDAKERRRQLRQYRLVARSDRRTTS